MKKRTFLAALLILAGNVASSQEGTIISDMGGGGFTIGYGNMDVSGLHTFVPSSVSTFSNNHLLLGGTGHGFIGRLVIGGGGFGIIGDTFVTDSLKGDVSGGTGTFDFGYLIVNKDRLKIFPMLGIGGGGYGINMTKTGNLNINEIVSNPGQGINVSQGGMVADLSINLYTIPALMYDKAEDSYGGFLIGLKIGYLYSIPNNTWNYSGGDIIGGPEFGLNMPYAKLVIGGFGYKKTLQ